MTNKAERPATTYHQLAQVDEELGGRFAHSAVSGTAPTVSYPQLPSTSPWAGNADVGVEPPLGVEVDAQEPTGEAFEVAQSLAEATEEPTLVSSPDVVEPLASADPHTIRRRI